MTVEVRLLGPPSVRHRGGWVEPPAGRTATLLWLLAYRGGWVGREVLADLLWPDAPGSRARSNLRKLLVRARELPWAAGVEAERDRLRWPVETDVTAFRTAVEDDRLEDAVALYRGPLLEGVAWDDLPALEDWLRAERETLHGLWRGAALRAATTGDPSDGAAQTLLGSLLEADPLDEEAVQEGLRLATRRPDRVAALSRYERFRERLGTELALEPLPETVALAERLRAAAPEAGAAAPPAAPAPAAAGVRPAPLLPRDLTPFVERPRELREVHERLDASDGRLVTIVGPGGVGKTRLAFRALADRESRYPDGVRAVLLEETESREGLVAALASGLGIGTAGRDLEARLVAALAPARALLLLDNVEQLGAEAGWLPTLLRHAPGLQVLLTSREALGLQGEWLVPIGGLEVPAATGTLPTVGAPRLFLETARRFGLEPEAGLEPDVLRICRAVDGLPLALELAASWVRLLSVGEIADEIERDADFLRSRERDRPARHRSLRAVFEGSWAHLDADERRALGALAVFRGGFDRAAAAEVAGVRAATLLSLVGRSLLRRRGDGRYDLHPMVRRYAGEKPAPAAAARLRGRHARVFATRLRAEAASLHGPDGAAALRRLAADHDNLLAAWRQLVAEGAHDELRTALRPLFTYFEASRRYREGAAAFGEAERALGRARAGLEPPRGLLDLVRARLAALRARVAEFGAAREALEACLARTDDADERAFLHEQLGTYVHYWLEDLDASEAALAAARARFEATGDRHGLARTTYQLGALAWHRGDYDGSAALLRAAHEDFERLGDGGWVAHARAGLATLAYEVGDLDRARSDFEALLGSASSFPSPIHLGLVLGNYGLVLAAQGETRAAREALERSLRIHEELGDRPWVSELHAHLGRVDLAEGDRAAARGRFRRALEIGLDVASHSAALRALVGFADLAAEARPGEAAALYRYVIAHPATVDTDRRQARAGLAGLEATPEAEASALVRSLDEIAARLLADDPGEA